jgi:hypothetical protein
VFVGRLDELRDPLAAIAIVKIVTNQVVRVLAELCTKRVGELRVVFRAATASFETPYNRRD